MGTRTVGFAVDEKDEPRLERLVRVFGGGNRSAFLRVALDHMERVDRAERLQAIQRYGVERSAELGLLDADIVALVKGTLRKRPPRDAITLDDINALVDRVRQGR